MKTAKGVALVAIVCALVFVVSGQVSSPQSQITAPIDNSKLTVLRGNVPGWAQAQFDRGPAPASLPMEQMMLVLKSTPDQMEQLHELVEEQQVPTSPNYHKWLTPEQFGSEFGTSEADIQTITTWLNSEGFTVDRVANGRNVIVFSGTAANVQTAFHAAIHKYVIGGKQFWSNNNDPAIPEALSPVIAGIASLNNFPRVPASRFLGTFTRNRAGKLVRKAAARAAKNPQYTYPAGCNGTNSDGSLTDCYSVTPYDFATIYNVLPLWNASTPINGSGQTIAIVSDSDIYPADFSNFRALFGLPAGTLNRVYTPGSDASNPGVQPPPDGNEGEADVDTEWSGAVAPDATIDLVISADTNTSFGGDISAQYIIDNKPALNASVMGYSYGECEFFLGTAGNEFYGGSTFEDGVSGEWTQAASEGITVVVSTGDNGSTFCDSPDNTPGPGALCVAPNQSPTPYDDPAVCGLAVNGIASTPYNVAVGGTDFNDGTLTEAETYWNSSNASTGASVMGYIPEIAYNDTCVNVPLDALYDSTYSESAEANCNAFATAAPPTTTTGSLSEFVLPYGGGGGASNCTTYNGTDISDCSGGYAKPSWQTGTGVPSDGVRDLPDVAIFAGDGTFQNFYSYCEEDEDPSSAPCSLTSSVTIDGEAYAYPDIQGVGGTSVAAEVFAGMMALLNQQEGSSGPVGLPNQNLYALAGQSWADCNSSGTLNSGCIFYQVTSGSNAMPCGKGTPDCVISTSSAPPAIGPGALNRWRAPVILLLGCALSLISFWFFRRTGRGWGVASACVVLLAFAGIAGCGGGSSSTSCSGSSCTVTNDYTVGIVEANGSLAYNATAGYNMATGLGSLNVYNLVTEWNVNTSSDFVLSASPAAILIAAPGGSGTTTITNVAVGSFSGTVDFSSSSCSGLPSGATCTFSQPAVPTGQTTTLTITAPSSPGIEPVPVTITGATGTESRTTTVMLTVQ
jgi:hypothetical protein